MTYVQYPYQVLSQLGQNLGDISSRLDGKQQGATDCNGLGSWGGSVEEAINDFRSQWKTSVSELVEDIGKWGGITKAIGDMAEQLDAGLGAAMAASPSDTDPRR